MSSISLPFHELAPVRRRTMLSIAMLSMTELRQLETRRPLNINRTAARPVDVAETLVNVSTRTLVEGTTNQLLPVSHVVVGWLVVAVVELLWLLVHANVHHPVRLEAVRIGNNLSGKLLKINTFR